MRVARLLLLLVGSIALVYLLFSHGLRRSRAQSRVDTPTSCCTLQEGLREIDFPYYSLRDGFNSQLNLVSDSPHAIDLTITLYSQRGNSVLTSTSIQPSAKLAIDLRALLTSLGADVNGEFGEGSIAVNFEGTVMPVVGQVTLTNPALRLVHETEMVENDPGRSDIPAVLNGLWWNLAPGRDARIMVANMSAIPAAAEVYLDYQGQRHASASLSFQPHELKVLSVLELLGQQNVSPAEAPEGGITILQSGGVPRLVAQGRVLDSVTGFSTTLHFPSPDVERASALHASGVPIGTPSKDSPFANLGEFTPHVVLRNLLSTAQSVTLTVEYPTAAGWNSTGDRRLPAIKGAKTAPPLPDPSTLTGQIALPPVALPGYSTQDIALNSLLAGLPQTVPYGSIRIQYTGAPGSVVAEVSSVEQSKDLVVDTKVANEGDGWAGSGANPWHLDSETDSMLFLTNMSDQSAHIGFRVWAGGTIYYLTKLRLAAHETRVIDLRQLRDAQQADFKKNKIPANATDGSVDWIRTDNVAVMGRVVVISRHGGVASSYGCSVCECPGAATLLVCDPSTFALMIESDLPLVGNETIVSCNDGYTYEDVTDDSGWDSSDTGVASVSSTGVVDGLASGTSTITASLPSVCKEYVFTPDRGCICEEVVTLTGYSQGVVVAIQYTSNGQNITNTTQSVVTGQQIALTGAYSLPSGVTVTSQAWTVGGTVVGGYTPTSSSYSSASVTAPTLDQQSTTFYWANAGSSLQVKFSLTLSNGASGTATVNFNISGVTSPSMGVQNYGVLTIDTLTGCSEQPGGPYMVYGNVSGPAPPCAGSTTGTPGISFAATGTEPSGGGTFSFVQLINSDSRTYTNSSGTVSCSNSAGLDTQYPYPLNNLGQATDAPEIPLPSTYSTANRAFNATMWLLWTPSAAPPAGCVAGTTCTIPIPVAHTTWQFSGSTTQSNGTWGTPSGSGSAGALTLANGSYPTWTTIAAETCN